MLAFDIFLIAAFFPVFGMCMLHACRVRHARWDDATATGFVSTLLAGAIFYDVGKFQFFVPCMVGLLAVFLLLCSSGFAGYIRDAVSHQRRSGLGFLVTLFVFGCVVLAGRIPVSNFIFEIGDAGGYVNSANHLALAGTSTTQFFPLNQVLLGIFAVVGGASVTPYGVLVASIAGTWFAVLLGRAYFGGWRAGWLAGILVGLNVLAMWFGRLPYSESLMLACNLGALAYWKMAADEEPVRYRYYILFGLFVAAACLTRVTGIIWMLVMSGTLLFLCLRRSKKTQPFSVAFVIAALGYALSIQIALKWGANYYINWQLKAFLPWLKTPHAIIDFHCAWVFVLVVLAVVLYRLSPRLRIPQWISNRTDAITLLLFLGFLFLATVHFVKDWRQWLVVGAAYRLAEGRFPEDGYYLSHYFTVLAIPFFFAGWFFLFRRRDPFKAESWSVFWLFSCLFLMISFIRPTYGISHDVYMYWDRYFVSDTFIVFVLVISAGALWAFRNQYTRWFAVLFIGAYLVQAIIWIGDNRNSKYLSGGYEMIAWLKSNIPRSNSVVFLDNQYGGGWLFPNLRRTILVPLSHSFDYDTKGTGIAAGAFSPDAQLDPSAVAHALSEGKQVYVVRATRDGQDSPPTSLSLPLDIVGRRAFVVTAKPSQQGRVFAGVSRQYPIALTIGHLWSMRVDIESSSRTGIYGDNIWTNGNASLRGLNVCPPREDGHVVLNTYGYIPPSMTADDINLQIYANNMLLHGKWESRTRYVATIPGDITCIRTLAFKSNSFVPKKLGINDDSRPLGIDLKDVVVQ